MEVRFKEIREGRLSAKKVSQILFVYCVVAIVPTSEPIRSTWCSCTLASSTRPGSILLVIVPHLVIFFALLGIGEHLIGFIDLFELLLRCGIAWVYIGVKLPCELAIRLLNLLLVRVLVHAEDLIVVFIVNSHMCLSSLNSVT